MNSNAATAKNTNIAMNPDSATGVFFAAEGTHEKGLLMAKAKSKATVMVADGTGGMAQVQDRRFEPPGVWPVCFEVPTRAVRHLAAIFLRGVRKTRLEQRWHLPTGGQREQRQHHSEHWY